MALQKNIKLVDNFGIEVQISNAYIKVDRVDCSKSTSYYDLLINKEKNGDRIQYIRGEFEYKLENENPIKQAYLHLKTLPEYSDATDC